jgi:hypothetical protein
MVHVISSRWPLGRHGYLIDSSTHNGKCTNTTCLNHAECTLVHKIMRPPKATWAPQRYLLKDCHNFERHQPWCMRLLVHDALTSTTMENSKQEVFFKFFGTILRLHALEQGLHSNYSSSATFEQKTWRRNRVRSNSCCIRRSTSV